MTRNKGFTLDSEREPICDDCGVTCRSGFSWQGDPQEPRRVTRVSCFTCRDKRDLAQWHKTHRFCTSFATAVTIKTVRSEHGHALGDYAAPSRSLATIEGAIARFAPLFWPPMCAQIDAEKDTKGMRAESVDACMPKILTYVSCGRVLITIESRDASITLIVAEHEAGHVPGLQGIDATMGQACDLLAKTAAAFVHSGAALVADPNVGIG